MAGHDGLDRLTHAIEVTFSARVTRTVLSFPGVADVDLT
jgi:hypothetical protein